MLLVFLASSAALLLVRLAPGDHLASFETNPAAAAAERHRLGLDRPLAVQYASWLAGALQLNFGESAKYQRPVGGLVAERAVNTILLGLGALVLATAIGIPLGTWTGSANGVFASAARGVSMLLLCVPPLVTSFALLLVAASTGWLPVGGFPAEVRAGGEALARARYLLLPTLALALPVAASLERLQSTAIRDALGEPSILAARARGLPASRLLWRHALRLSLRPLLGIYGIVVGTILSGSFVVEIVMSWPGLGALMYEALVARDLFLVAGCAAAVSACLALGVLVSDIGLALADPRIEDAW